MRSNASLANGRHSGPPRSRKTSRRGTLPFRDGTQTMTDRSDLSTRSLRADLLLALALIALCVAARLLPHVQNFSPVAAAALFAGAVMGRRSLAVVVAGGALALGG